MTVCWLSGVPRSPTISGQRRSSVGVCRSSRRPPLRASRCRQRSTARSRWAPCATACGPRSSSSAT
eukprot:5244978-Alexandrium_andersonii.AAC.1